jgi:hypothetical protein
MGGSGKDRHKKIKAHYLIRLPPVMIISKRLGIPLKSGRDFSKDFGTDSLGVILNEAAVKRNGFKKSCG